MKWENQKTTAPERNQDQQSSAMLSVSDLCVQNLKV